MLSAMDRLNFVDGLDVEKGIVMCGGVEENYRIVLAQYCLDAEQFLPVLRETLGNTAGIKKQEGKPAGASPLPWLQAFVIQVHAIKSSSATIGAEALSREAMLLEKAGSEGDLELIKTRLEAFIQRFSELVSRISGILQEAQHTEAP